MAEPHFNPEINDKHQLLRINLILVSENAKMLAKMPTLFTFATSSPSIFLALNMFKSSVIIDWPGGWVAHVQNVQKSHARTPFEF